MIETLTLDGAGRLILPEAVQRVLKVTPGSELRADVTERGITVVEVFAGETEAPVNLEKDEFGNPVFRSSHPVSGEDIVAAIKNGRRDREDQIADGLE